MRWKEIPQSPRDTAVTLAVGATGATMGWMINAPVYVLLGPALLVSCAGLLGVRTAIMPLLRDSCFILLGLAVGAGFDHDALGAMIRWPVAFAAMVGLIWIILVVSRALLVHSFDFDRRSAVLASAPGHLSFVISMASETGADVARISVTQSVRLLSLTLSVPLAAMAMGINVEGSIAPQGDHVMLVELALLVVCAVALGRGLAYLSVPAPLLMGAMIVSAAAQLTQVVDGVVPDYLTMPAYLVLGALIGTRFNGIRPRQVLESLVAGLAITLVAIILSAIASVPIAYALGMPMAHVLIAFAPGGLETMIAMGAFLGVMPGFVAACHITRLFALSALLPMMMPSHSNKRDL